MAFDSMNRYSPSHKPWDHVGNAVPSLEVSEGIRPAFEAKPAAWLPVQFYDKYFENWIVIPNGMPVALDPDGRLMPAFYGLSGGALSVVYTQNDVNAGVIDISTGQALTAAKTVLLAALTGEKGSAWTLALAGTADNSSYRSGFMGRFGDEGAWTEASVARFHVGVASMPYLQWAGGDGSNPYNFSKHNYNMQHLVTVTCDYVMQYPHVPAQQADETVTKTVSGTLTIGTAGTHTRAVAQAHARYNATEGTFPILSTYPVIALATDNTDLATQTDRTLYTLESSSTADDVSSILVNEKSSAAAVQAAGDYWIDYEGGVIFIYSSDGATVPTAISGAAGTVQLTYYRNSGAVAGTISKFAQVLGPVKPGDLLKVGTSGHLVRAADNIDFQLVVGQVLEVQVYPRSGLDRVRTAYNPAISTDATGGMSRGSASSASTNAGQLDKMPGSATGGVPWILQASGGADEIVIVNLIGR